MSIDPALLHVDTIVDRATDISARMIRLVTGDSVACRPAVLSSCCDGVMNRPAPPVVSGTVPPRLRDVLRMVWWGERGNLHGIRHGSAATRVLSLILALSWWPAYVLLVSVQLVVVGWPASRYYMSSERDAVIALVATRRDSWIVFDHICARPGSGRGRDLRRAVFMAAREVADERGVSIETTAVSRRIAEIYAADLPGLVDIRPAFPRGRRMRREPRGVRGSATP